MADMKKSQTSSLTLKISLTAVSAALYAAAAALTASIPTPWGVGQFRPGVLVPAFFALAYGPLVGGFGAAIGTFVGEAITGFVNTTPILSLVAGVPANFAGFYLLGWLMQKRSTWGAFIVTAFVSLIVGNLIAAIGVVGYFSTVSTAWASWSISLKVGTVLGLTFFWVATMIPFVIPLMPPLIRATKPILGSGRGSSNAIKLSWGKPSEILKSTFAVSLTLAALYLIVTLTPLGGLMFSLFAAFWVETLILISSVIVMVFGLIVAFLVNRKEIGVVAGESP